MSSVLILTNALTLGPFSSDLAKTISSSQTPSSTPLFELGQDDLDSLLRLGVILHPTLSDYLLFISEDHSTLHLLLPILNSRHSCGAHRQRFYSNVHLDVITQSSFLGTFGGIGTSMTQSSSWADQVGFRVHYQ